jgi:hypothetical protein
MNEGGDDAFALATRFSACAGAEARNAAKSNGTNSSALMPTFHWKPRVATAALSTSESSAEATHKGISATNAAAVLRA